MKLIIPLCLIFSQNGLEQFHVSTQTFESGNASLMSEIIFVPKPEFLFSGLCTTTLRIWILFGLMNTQQLAIGILPLYIQQFSCLGCSQKPDTPLIDTILPPHSVAFSLVIMFIFISPFIIF